MAIGIDLKILFLDDSAIYFCVWGSLPEIVNFV